MSTLPKSPTPNYLSPDHADLAVDHYIAKTIDLQHAGCHDKIREAVHAIFGELRRERTMVSESPRIEPPTDAEIAAYRDLFRRELNKRMDTNHTSASPSTESHAVALRSFVETRNARTVR